jgi:hypothetical protein
MERQDEHCLVPEIACSDSTPKTAEKVRGSESHAFFPSALKTSRRPLRRILARSFRSGNFTWTSTTRVKFLLSASIRRLLKSGATSGSGSKVQLKRRRQQRQNKTDCGVRPALCMQWFEWLWHWQLSCALIKAVAGNLPPATSIVRDCPSKNAE